MSLLHVEGLKKVYTTRFGGQQVEALQDVNFEVGGGRVRRHHGRIRVSGKTTLLNILAALDRPDGRRACCSTARISPGSARSDMAAFRRDHLGFVFQEFNLLDTFSLKDNILPAARPGGEELCARWQKRLAAAGRAAGDRGAACRSTPMRSPAGRSSAPPWRAP